MSRVQQLVAYVVPVGRSISSTALREHLRGSLPDYMVPQAFVPIDDLPLTPNGKLDRGRCRAGSSPARTRRAPRTPQEEILCGLFAECSASNGSALTTTSSNSAAIRCWRSG